MDTQKITKSSNPVGFWRLSNMRSSTKRESPQKKIHDIRTHWSICFQLLRFVDILFEMFIHHQMLKLFRFLWSRLTSERTYFHDCFQTLADAITAYFVPNKVKTWGKARTSKRPWITLFKDVDLQKQQLEIACLCMFERENLNSNVPRHSKEQHHPCSCQQYVLVASGSIRMLRPAWL